MCGDWKEKSHETSLQPERFSPLVELAPLNLFISFSCVGYKPGPKARLNCGDIYHWLLKINVSHRSIAILTALRQQSYRPMNQLLAGIQRNLRTGMLIVQDEDEKIWIFIEVIGTIVVECAWTQSKVTLIGLLWMVGYISLHTVVGSTSIYLYLNVNKHVLTLIES